MKIRNMELTVQKLMETQIFEFNIMYSDLFKKADKFVEHAELDENYMPVINDVANRQASSYFLKFLLIY